MDDVVAGIGRKVRELRRQRGLSLQRLAERSGVSAAAIHKLERNGMVPTVTTLMKLANALERSVSYFVDEDQEERRPVALTRAGEGRPVYTSKEGLDLSSISGPYGQFLLAGAVATIEPHADSGSSAMVHPGEELLYVLEGSMEVDVDEDTFALGPGDALHFLTEPPHRWRNPADEPAKVLWLAIRSR